MNGKMLDVLEEVPTSVRDSDLAINLYGQAFYILQGTPKDVSEI